MCVHARVHACFENILSFTGIKSCVKEEDFLVSFKIFKSRNLPSFVEKTKSRSSFLSHSSGNLDVKPVEVTS